MICFDLKMRLNDFGLYRINSLITYILASWFTKKCFEKYLLAFNWCFWRRFHCRTCQEPPL